MTKAKRARQKARRQAQREEAMPALTDADLHSLLADVTVRTDCEHASTRTTPVGTVLTRCAVGAAVAGGCPRDCGQFEKRRVGGLGL